MEKIHINRKIVSKTNTFQITNDVIVPDIKPDIVNIIAVNGVPYIYKQELENQKAKLDGNIDAFIIYLSADGDTRSIQTTLNFNNNLEDNKIKENCILKTNIKVDSLESKVLNERKLSVIATLSVEYLISEIQEIEISNEFLENIPMLQKREKELEIKSLIGANISKTTLKEDINIEEDIAEVLKIEINILNGEEKISYNKILTKGECNINIIYITEEGKINRAQESFPIMSFVDMDNISENANCKIDYNIRNMLFKINSKQEHSLTFQIDFEIFCEAYENKNINLISDLYSLSNDLNISYKNVELENKDEETNLIEIDERIKLDDLKTFLCLENCGVLILKNDNYNIEGEVKLRLYYEITSNNGLEVKDVKIPFIVKVKNKNDFKFEVENIETDSFDDEVRINIKLKMITINSEENSSNIRIIDSVNVLDKIDSDDYNVVVYLVKKNDDIWNIAKNFKVTTDSISRVNNLDNPESVYPGDKLYILK